MLLKSSVAFMVGSLLLQLCVAQFWGGIIPTRAPAATTTTTAAPAARPHPLDPLTESEINKSTRVINADSRASGKDLMFNYMYLLEPPKLMLLPYFLQDTNPPTNIPRRSRTIILDRKTNKAYEVTVNLDTGKVDSWNDAPNGVTPTLTPEELLLGENIVRNDSRVITRSKDLGYPNMSLVNADPWSMGYIGDKSQYDGKRLAQFYLYGKNSENDNQYAHPFDFLCVVDLLAKKVIDIEELPTHSDSSADNKEGNTVPRRESNYDPALRPQNSFRKDLKPIKVSQSGGPSYTVNKNVISWQKYKLRVGFNGREGLILYTMSYKDGGKVRPLFYRMSLAEMFIPYGDPRSPYYRKHVFDEGQYGIGFNANSLKSQLDCIGEVAFIDAVLHNEKGQPQKFPKVVCISEVDDGILWKHTDYRTGKSAIVRNQRLAITFIATVGNYDYLFTWKLSMDGTIEFNVKLSGILSVNLLAVNSTTYNHSSVVLPQVDAQYHQHFFSLRLDAEIDGNKNSVTMNDVVAGPGTTGSTRNPYGQAWTTEKTLLTTASGARTTVETTKSRTWLISNPECKNPNTGGPVAWKLMPAPTPPMLLQKDSPIHPVAEWMDYNTWVTPYQEDQMFPGGFYVNSSGLPEWVRNAPDANVNNTDIVIWHNFGLSHVPRVEDFPVMPIEEISIHLKPYNFFDANPALDVPAPKATRAEL